MTLVDALLKSSDADRDVLRKNRELGDNPLALRPLDFLFYASSKEKADLVASFCTDNGYGDALVSHRPDNKEASQWHLLVRIEAPATEAVVCSLSGLMECLAHLFKIEYDGWGGAIVRDVGPANLG